MRVNVFGAVLCSAGLFLSLPAASQSFLPDPQLTPGAVNLDVTQVNLSETVCVPGWTKSIRPKNPYIDKLKREQMRVLNLPGATDNYREDHRVPLCAGGHPSDPRNLWPQPLEGQWRDADKNMLEASVCRQLCRGDITLEQAQAYFLLRDWTKVYEQYFSER